MSVVRQKGNKKSERGRANTKKAIRRLKGEKAVRIDGTPREVWKYGGREL